MEWKLAHIISSPVQGDDDKNKTGCVEAKYPGEDQDDYDDIWLRDDTWYLRKTMSLHMASPAHQLTVAAQAISRGT